jgi:hypothetical protein
MLTVPALLCFSGLAFAGDLTPPVGPVAPTMKTLQQVEPRIPIDAFNTPGDADSTFRISTPGNYYLTGDLVGEFGKHGIEIAASNVTIDLMGFELFGVFGTVDAINGQAAPAGVTVRNGRVSNWGDEGIDLESTDDVVIEDVVASGCGGWGVSAGDNSIVRDCAADACVIGVYVRGHGVVQGCAAVNNTSDGIHLGWGSHAAHCTSKDNAGNGFEIGNGCSVSDCASMSNGATGFRVGEGSSVTRCTSYQDILYGVRAGEGTTVADCTVRFARPAGIWLEDYAVARNNTVSQTINDGIVAADSCTVHGNSVLEAGVSTNFGHGIRVTGTDTRVEFNQVTDCDLGYKIEGTGNLIARNTSSGNTTHWDVVANNRMAATILGALNAAPVVGTTYGGSLGTTDPTANIVY